MPVVLNADDVMETILELSPTSNEKATALFYLSNGGILDMTSFPLIHDKIIQGRVWYFKDITEKTRLTNKLSFEATHDPLTKLINAVSLMINYASLCMTWMVTISPMPYCIWI